MGSLFKSGSQTTQTQNPYQQNPWGPQQGYVQQGLEGNRLASDNATVQAATGGLNADMNKTQMAGLQNIAGTSGLGSDAGQFTMGVGMNNLDRGSNFGQYGEDIYQRGLQDPTQNTIGRAGQFADNPYMQGMMDNVIADSNRALGRGIADLNAGVSTSGNMNSSRAGAMEANLRNEAADRVAGISANMRGDAYNQGLNLGANQYQGQINNQLAANAQLGQAGGQGLAQIQGGYNMGQSAGQNLLGAGEYMQNQEQKELDSMYLMPQQIQGNYLNAISGNYGGHGYGTNSQTTSTPSGFNQLVGATTSIMGGIGAMKCWVAREVYGVGDPRWLKFRWWLENDAPRWLDDLYTKHGQKFADWVRKHPWTKKVLRPLMNLCLKGA